MALEIAELRRRPSHNQNDRDYFVVGVLAWEEEQLNTHEQCEEYPVMQWILEHVTQRHWCPAENVDECSLQLPFGEVDEPHGQGQPLNLIVVDLVA